MEAPQVRCSILSEIGPYSRLRSDCFPFGSRKFERNLIVDPSGTHIPVLATCVARTSGPILELGCGDYSTPLLHALCSGRKLVSIESNRDWFMKFVDFQSPTHQLFLTKDLDNVGFIDQEQWDVVLIDHEPCVRRKTDLGRVRRNAKFVVVHDTELEFYGFEPVFKLFRYRYDYKRLTPWTTVVSDFERFEP